MSRPCDRRWWTYRLILALWLSLCAGIAVLALPAAEPQPPVVYDVGSS